MKEARSLTKLQQITVKQPKTVATTPKTAKKSPKSGVAADYSYGHTAEFETTIPTIDTIDTPTVKTTEKIYTDEVAKKVDFSGKSGIIELDLQFFAQIPEEKFTKYALDAEKQPDKARAFREALGYTKENYESLINNILNNFEEKNLRLKNENEYGKLYECVMRLTGANGKQANVCTGWIVEVGSDEPRLTSAYITNKEVTKK